MDSTQKEPMAAYGVDLARIHEDGFAHLAKNAAAELITHLPAPGASLPVVDLGCGGGTFAEVVTRAGYDVIGHDISAGMVEIAKRRVPKASFQVGSWVDASFSSLSAVVAIGEVLNYRFDDRCDVHTRHALFQRAYDALDEGGVFLFDVATSERQGAVPVHSFVNTDDWTVVVKTTSDQQFLTREITAFVRKGDLFRRSHETHRLRLIDPIEVVDDLQSIGFEVHQQSSYSGKPVPKGLAVFRAHKP